MLPGYWVWATIFIGPHPNYSFLVKVAKSRKFHFYQIWLCYISFYAKFTALSIETCIKVTGGGGYIVFFQ